MDFLISESDLCKIFTSKEIKLKIEQEKYNLKTYY